MSHLISYKSQIEPNLRRTASNGLISLLNHQQLEDLAFKYFGIKDEYGNIIGYQCPYSGKLHTDYQDIVLEHIIPVVSKGGTVLFNCIPTSKEVNGSDQKGAKHLITWWINSKYWSPERLERIVNYMLDGYEQVFTEYTIEEVESSYLDIETDESILDEKKDKNINDRTESKLLKQAKNNGIHSYLGFIYDCINALEKYNINTSSIKERLQQLQEKNIFKDIDKYQLYQNIIQQLVVSRIGDNNSSYLTYTLNFDIKKLMDLINLDNEQEIYNELNSRLQNIEQLLKENNLSTIEYFKSLRDISDIDVIYKNISDISQEEIQSFLENIKIGMDTKVGIFIEMLNQGNTEILRNNNSEFLEGYPGIKLYQFWQRHQEKIKPILFEILKDDQTYEEARQTVLKYFKVSNYEELQDKQKMYHRKRLLDVNRKITIFIDMLNEGNAEILNQSNDQSFEGYLDIPIKTFWRDNQDAIQYKLFIELKNDSTYENARQTVLKYFKVSNYEELQDKQKKYKSNLALDIETKIQIYIHMLNQGNSEILRHRNNKTLEGYPEIKLYEFWKNYQEKIKPILFEVLKDDPTYEKARQTVLKYFKASSYEELNCQKQVYHDIRALDVNQKIEIFIEMLNEGNSDILNKCNKQTFKGYSNIPIRTFWIGNQDEIQHKLFIELKDDKNYEKARQIVLKYFKASSYEELKDKKELYKTKRELDIETKIQIYIQMLNRGNKEILKNGNNETLDGYPHITLAKFWNSHQDKVKKILFKESKNDPKYESARQTVLTYFEVDTYEELEFAHQSNLHLRIACFIQMLNGGNIKIFKVHNNENFEGYTKVPVGKFWHHNKQREIIIAILFEKVKDNQSYDTARRLVLENLKVKNIDEYYEKKASISQQLKELEKMQQELDEAIKYIDEVDLTEQEQRKRA